MGWKRWAGTVRRQNRFYMRDRYLFFGSALMCLLLVLFVLAAHWEADGKEKQKGSLLNGFLLFALLFLLAIGQRTRILGTYLRRMVHIRMAEYQFINQMVTNIRYIKLRLLFTNPGIEGYMQ